MGIRQVMLLCALSKAMYQDLRPSLDGFNSSLVHESAMGERWFKSHYAIVRQGATLIVVFRGTTSLRDWATNLFSGPAKVADNLYAHRGFWTAIQPEMEPMLIALNRAVRERACARIYFTGHSKGGGEAILAYLWWVSNAWYVEHSFPRLRGAPVSVVTFGAPLVVMADDEQNPSKEARRLGQAVLNYVTHLDIVPRCLARRARWSMVEGYSGGVPTFLRASPVIVPKLWSVIWKEGKAWGERLSMEDLVKSSVHVRNSAIYALVYILEWIRVTPGPRYVPAGRFIELSPDGQRELSGEEMLREADLPERLSPEVVWDMIMHHYPERYEQALL